jgi:type VI protein secretion system component VasK
MERTTTSSLASRHRSLALLVAGATLLLAGCAQVGTSSFTFWDAVWSIILFFFWFMFIWIFISLFGDIFRRNDLSGGAKAVWLIALVLLPFLGALIYIAMRPKVTAQDVQMMARAEAGQKAVASVTTADELAKLQQLKDSGAITAEEFETLKKKTLEG